MKPVRFVSRSLLGALFVYSGIDVLRNPDPRAKAASPLLTRLTEAVPVLPEDPVQLVRVNAGLQVAAGSMLILGKMPRLSSLALAGSLVPTTAAGHPFWEEQDPQRAASQRAHFLKNGAVLGGLLATSMLPSTRRQAGKRRKKAATPAKVVRLGKAARPG